MRSEKRPVWRPDPRFRDFDLESYYAENGDRYYVTPNGDYPSVTTLLGRYSDSDKSGLERWKRSVGEERARKIMKSTGVRGTKLHRVIESYLKEEDEVLFYGYDVYELFNNIKPYLDQITATLALEQALYSDKYRMAGRCDCIAEVNGKNTLIDFKNARSRKEESWIKDYKLQATAYCIMLRETFGFSVDDFLILISNSEGEVQKFHGDLVDFIKDPFFHRVYNR